MKETDTYRLELSPDFSRDLPIIKLRGSEHKIASFVMLGDVELNKKCAAILVDKMKEKNLLEKFDYLVTLEAKGITLAHEVADILNFPRFVVIRKTPKKYMQRPLMVPSESITSGKDQTIVLDGLDIDRLRGKKVCLVEDVIATGGSVEAACNLLSAIGAEVTVIAAVLLKGKFEDPRLLYLAAPEM